MSKRETSGMHVMHTTLSRISYAAMTIGGIAGTIYAVTKGIRKRDLGAIWEADPASAPPRAFQNQLRRGEDVGRDEGGQPRNRKMHRLQSTAADEDRDEERDILQLKLQRAMRAGDAARVRQLSHDIEELEHGGRSAGSAPLRGQAPLYKNDDDDYVLTRGQRLSQSRGEGGPGRYGIERYDDDQYDGDRYDQPYHDDDLLHSQQDSSPAPPKRQHSEDSAADIRKGGRHPVSRPLLTGGMSLQRSSRRNDASSRSEERSSPRGHAALSGAAPGSCVTREGVQKVRLQGVSMPKARRTAMAKLRVGDLAKAECPISGAWHDATVHSIRENGLVEVRWHDPGIRRDGSPFQPLGDVWAENARSVFRRGQGRSEGQSHGRTDKQAPLESQDARESDEEGDEEAGEETDEKVEKLPLGLSLGDHCFAFGNSTIVGKHWFQVKLVSVHPKYADRVRVEYIATLDGERSALSLPEPRKEYIPVKHLRREAPQAKDMPKSATELAKSAAEWDGAAETKATQKTDDDVAIDVDLMCSVCRRPDDEDKMLVCNCKAGYHTHCLSPPLLGVPQGDWHCPTCAA